MASSILPSRSRGFTLIEAVLALALTAIVVGGVLNGLLYADRMSIDTAVQLQGRLLAEECVAVVRWLRDADGYAAFSEGSYGLSKESGRWMLSGAPDETAGHTREVSITDERVDEKRVACGVSWLHNDQAASISLETLLSR